jgi:hypothetical protein
LKNNYLKLLKIKARNFLNVSKKSGFVRLELGFRGFSKKMRRFCRLCPLRQEPQ